MTIAELRDHFMTRLRAENRSPHTIRAYAMELRTFARFLGPDSNVAAIDRFTVRRYLMARQGARSSTRRRRAVLKSCMEEAINLGALLDNPVDATYAPRMHHRLPYCPTEAELLPALAKKYSPEFSAWPARDKALIAAAYATMARLDELHGMDLSHIDWSHRTILVTGKGSKQRLVVFGVRAARALRAYIPERARLLESLGKQTEALFLNRTTCRPRGRSVVLVPDRAGERISTRRLYSTITRVCKGLGLPKIHPHSLRRAGATHMLNHGADLRVIQQLLGHTKLMTTAIYAKLAPERLRNVLETTHPDNREAKC